MLLKLAQRLENRVQRCTSKRAFSGTIRRVLHGFSSSLHFRVASGVHRAPRVTATLT